MKLVENAIKTRIRRHNRDKGLKIKPVTIRCPKCGHTQEACALHHYLSWWIRIKECDKCNYIILESEWDEVNEQTKANS